MKKRSMRLFALLLAAMMTCTACQAPAEDSTTANQGTKATEATKATEESKETEAPTEPAPTWTNDDEAEITIMLVQSAVPGVNDLITAKLEEITGTKINMVSVAAKDYSTKLGALVGAEEVPDILYITSMSAVQKYIDGGILANVYDVMNAVAPNVVEEVKDILYEIPVNKEGEVYMIPFMKKDYQQSLAIRTDWLENLGMKMPTTLEEYKEVLRAFTEDDPNKNGIDDTYGLAFNLSTVGSRAFQHVFGAYGIPSGGSSTSVTIELEDGTISTWVKHPRFLEAMTYIRSLVDAGYCEPDYISIPSNTLYEKLWTGVAGVFEFQAVGTTNNWLGRYTEDPIPSFDFAMLTGPYGDFGGTATYQDYNSGFVFAADSENLEGCLRIANFCMSDEGSELMTFGIEGEMWQWVDEENGKIEYLGEYTDSTIHRATGAYCYNRLFVPSNSAEIRTLNTQTRNALDFEYENRIDWAYIPYTSKVAEECGSDMNQIYSEMMAELFTTTDDLQTVYDKYMAQWEEEGGTDWEKEMTEFWKEMSK